MRPRSSEGAVEVPSETSPRRRSGGHAAARSGTPVGRGESRRGRANRAITPTGSWPTTRTPVRIEVHLFANLADYRPGGARDDAATVELPDGATVAELVIRLAIPEELPRFLLVNGRDATPETRLQAGDVVSFLPPLAGG